MDHFSNSRETESELTGFTSCNLGGLTTTVRGMRGGGWVGTGRDSLKHAYIERALVGSFAPHHD